jgi:hypothetical protein
MIQKIQIQIQIQIKLIFVSLQYQHSTFTIITTKITMIDLWDHVLYNYVNNIIILTHCSPYRPTQFN